MKTLIFSVLILSYSTVKAETQCTPWVRAQSMNCQFLGEWTQIWTRHCEEPCREVGEEIICELNRICINDDPNELQGPCSDWREVRGTTCVNPQTRRYEQKWVRACQSSLPVIKCSND